MPIESLSPKRFSQALLAWYDQHVPHPEIITHAATHISLSDGGAHTRYQTSSAWPTPSP